MKKNLFFFAILSLSACKSPVDFEYIKSTEWLYDNGFRITETIQFNNSMGYSLSADTIFLDGKPRAIIVALDKKSYNLTIKSLDGQKTGNYMDELETLQ